MINNNLKDIFAFQQKTVGFHPDFGIGDTIKVHFLLKENKKTRIQMFEGVVMFIKGSLNNKSFCLRKAVGDFSVEKHFLYHSPLVKKIEVIRKGRVRRSKIYYLRNLRGKASRIKEKKK